MRMSATGSPSTFMMRPRVPAPTGTDTARPVLLCAVHSPPVCAVGADVDAGEGEDGPLRRLEVRMTDKEFGENYFGTPVPRTKRRGLARNAAIALGNVGTEADIPILAQTLESYDELIDREHAAWALGRLGAQTELRRGANLDQPESVQLEIEMAIGSTARI